MKIFHNVNDWNIFAINNDCSNIDLSWHKINIADYYFVQFFNVDNRTFFSDWFFVFNDGLSDYKNEIIEKNRIFCSFHFFLLMQLVKCFVDKNSIFDFKRIDSINFQIINSIKLQRNRHIIWFENFDQRVFLFS